MDSNYIEEIKNNLALNAYIARKCLGYNHNELASISGLTRPVLSGIENAAVNPTLETLIKLSVSLDLDLDLLFLSRQRFDKYMELMKFEFDTAKLNVYEIVISEENWKKLLKLSVNKEKSTYRHVIKCISETVKFNFPEIDQNLKNRMVYTGTLGFIYQQDGFKLGVEFGIWLAGHLFD